jgi:methyltransferase
MTESSQLTKSGMRDLIVTYFDACNAADVDTITASFVPDGVHYFPPGMYGGAFVGNTTIAQRWADAVQNFGSIWTIDAMIVDADTAMAVVEWSHFKTKHGKLLRGNEWYDFDRSTGLIREIRAYYASPQAADLETLELEGFDYAGRGYVLEPPFTR